MLFVVENELPLVFPIIDNRFELRARFVGSTTAEVLLFESMASGTSIIAIVEEKLVLHCVLADLAPINWKLL